MMGGGVRFEVANNCGTKIEADVLVLKYAQRLYGMDRHVFNLLKSGGINVELPVSGGSSFECTNNLMRPEYALFVGVESLIDFGYREIYNFSKRSLRNLYESGVDVKSIAITLHGVGYGLDEMEAMRAEVCGLVASIKGGFCPKLLERIVFVEKDRRRAQRMGKYLSAVLPGKVVGFDILNKCDDYTENSLNRRKVFVARPFSKDMEDVFRYGICGAVKAIDGNALCEDADLKMVINGTSHVHGMSESVDSLSGDVVEYIKKRISSANVVVADMTGNSQNVYLEVGFAWGLGVPTILISKDPDTLLFNVRNQRCVKYDNIIELEEKLTVCLSPYLNTP